MPSGKDFVYAYDTSDDDKFLGFFINRASAEAWHKKQDKKDVIEIRDTPPPRKPTEDQTSVDSGLDEALKKVQE